MAERQRYGDAGACAVHDGFGELHIANAGLEVGKSYRQTQTNRIDEIRLDLPDTRFVRRDGDFRQRFSRRRPGID